MHVLIVDDHPLYIKGVQALLFELNSSIQTAGALNLEAAFAMARCTQFDLVLLDLAMPGVSRLDALSRMRNELPDVPVIVISGDESPQMIWDAIELGAAGYIPKDTDQSLTIQALQLVLARGVYVPPHALKHQHPVTRHKDSNPARAAAPQLTPRQLAVLKALLQGKSNKVIARDLNITEATVKAHVSALIQTLGVSTRLNVMVMAHEMKLVELFPTLSNP